MKIDDVASEDSRFFLKSEWGPASSYWPAVSFSKQSVGRHVRQSYRPALDFIVYAGTSDPKNTEQPEHRKRLLSLVKIEPNTVFRTWELIPQTSWEKAQTTHAGRWPYSYAILNAWDIESLPLATELVPKAYRRLGIRANWGGVTEIEREEVIPLLTLHVRPVELQVQTAAKKAATRRRLIDAPSAVKTEIYRIAELITMRKEQSGTLSNRWNPVRHAPPSSVLQEMLFGLWEEQQGRCGLCEQAIPITPRNKLLQLSPDRIDSGNSSYDKSNVHITHLACNLAKNKSSADDFREWLEVVNGDQPLAPTEEQVNSGSGSGVPQ